MKNFLIFLFISILSAVVIYSVGSSLLKTSLEQKLSEIPIELKKYGINSQNPRIDKILVKSTKSLEITDIRTIFSYTNKKYFSNQEQFSFKIGKLSLLSKDHNFSEVTIKIEDLNITSIDNKEEIRSYENLNFQNINTTIKNQNKFQIIDTLINEVANIISDKETNLDLKINGKLHYNDGEFSSIAFKDNNFLLENIDPLEKQGFNQEEIELLKSLPLRVATIQNIKSESLAFQGGYSHLKNKDAVLNIHYLTSLINKFGGDSTELTNRFLKQKDKKHLLLTKQYMSEKKDLVNLIQKQGNKFPIERKSSFTVN